MRRWHTRRLLLLESWSQTILSNQTERLDFDMQARLSFTTFLPERVPMRVLLSTIGSRGDVQPMVALALQLRELGQEVRICAPPDFREWIGTLGIPFVPVGPEVRQTAAPRPSAAKAPPTPEQLRHVMEDTVAGQFEAITA